MIRNHRGIQLCSGTVDAHEDAFMETLTLGDFRQPSIDAHGSWENISKDQTLNTWGQ